MQIRNQTEADAAMQAAMSKALNPLGELADFLQERLPVVREEARRAGLPEGKINLARALEEFAMEHSASAAGLLAFAMDASACLMGINLREPE